MKGLLVYLSDEQYKQLKKVAYESDKKMVDILRKSLDMFFKKE